MPLPPSTSPLEWAVAGGQLTLRVAELCAFSRRSACCKIAHPRTLSRFVARRRAPAPRPLAPRPWAPRAAPRPLGPGGVLARRVGARAAPLLRHLRADESDNHALMRGQGKW